MPILGIDLGAQTATQKCAGCGIENAIRLSDLRLGDGPSDDGASAGVNPDAIRLPACCCGAQEWLFRTWDTCPAEHADTFFAEHRRLVNGLAQVLRDEGRSHPAAAKAHAAEQHVPRDIAALPPRGRVTARLAERHDDAAEPLEEVTPAPAEVAQPDPPVVIRPVPAERVPADVAAPIEVAQPEPVVGQEPAPAVPAPAEPAPAESAPAVPAPAEPAPGPEEPAPAAPAEPPSQ